MQTISESDVSALAGVIVILGDPGLGKTFLMERLGSGGNNRYVRAGTFARSKAPDQFSPKTGGRLVVDGLDEIASAATGGGLDAVLGHLSALGNPPVILSSREADWLGSASRVRIEDDYGTPVSILHLQPFDRDDARAFLQSCFPDINAETVLDHLAARNLGEISRNPLTLRMIGELASAEATLPGTRAELIERTCTIMLREANERHHNSAHAQRADGELLLAAGAICAGLLICDRLGVHTGPLSVTTDDLLHLSSIQVLPHGAAAGDALRTRLFQADGQARFVACHRVVAEHLGARWLAKCFEHGASERRILSLLIQPRGVPTSLRGLNAWVSHFSGKLAPACIAADPYAVLRYGNAETLPLEQARDLLRGLAMLSSEDPYFRSEDWSRHPAAGLMRVELKPEIMAHLSDERAHAHLSMLLLEAMADHPIAAALQGELQAILFDPDRSFATRSRAGDALTVSGVLDPAASIVRLLSLGDIGSQRLAFELLARQGFTGLPMRLVVEALLAHAGLTVSSRDRMRRDRSLHVPRELLEALSWPELQCFLDCLAEYAAPLMRDDGRPGGEVVADAARTAVLVALRSGWTVEAGRIWRWLRWVRHRSGYDREAGKGIRDHLAANVNLRQGLQAAALLDVCPKRVGYEASCLRDLGAHFHDDGDAVALLALIGTRSGGKPELQRLREVVLLARGRVGLPPGVRKIASTLGGGDPTFQRDLDDWSKPIVNEHERREKRRAAKVRAKRAKTYRRIREEHAAAADSIRAGEFRWLHQPALAYLGRFSEFSSDDPPEARVEALLGPVLAAVALDGFMASLHRTDLPSAADIAQTHAEGREWAVEIVLVCGIAAMVRRELSLDGVPRPAIQAAYMAWRRQHESNTADRLGIGSLLGDAVLAGEVETEAFFRTSIEPQLRARLEFIDDLHMLTNDRRWSALAGRLSVEWLIRHQAFSPRAETDLLDLAVRHGGPLDLARLGAASTSRVHASLDALVEWLATDFVLDFDRARPHLAEAARDDGGFLWRIRDRVSDGRSDVVIPLTITQRAFVVEAFSPHWPQALRPTSSYGDTGPWDASEFIERMISAIAADPRADATAVLQQLLTAAEPSYTVSLRHALAQQRKLRRDHEYVPATIAHLLSVSSNALPETIDDMRAYFADRLATLQTRMHASNTDMWEAYWNGSKPCDENHCRNRLIEHISGQLPAAIRFEPEMHMPNQKRADIAAIYGSLGLPVEIKGQWHPEVWNAATEQLAARYARDWHASGRGAYIVLWFGNVPRKQLPRHPAGRPRPGRPEELRALLREGIPEALQGLIDVHVVDVSRSR